MKTFTDFIEEIFERAEEEDERDKPDRNVVMQARKAVNMGSKDITFHDGKTHNVSRAHAQKFLHKHTSATRDNKLSIQNHAQQSHKNFMSHTEEVEVDFDEGTGSKVCDQCENGKTETGSTCKPCGGTGYDMSSAKPATEALVGDQHKLDHNKDNKISKSDMKMVRKVGAVKEVTARSSGYGIRNKVSDMPGVDYSWRDKYKGSAAVKTAVKNANAQSDAKRAEYRKKMGMKEGKAYGPTGVSYAVPKGHKDEVDPKTREKYPERQKAVKQSNPDNYKPFNKEEIKLIDKTGSYVSKKETYAEQMANMMTNLIIKTNVKVEEAKGTHVTKDGKVAKKGLWYNIAQKKKRGGEPAEVGDADRPSAADMKRSQ